ncbi:MAG: hypothetical protein INH41_14345 [Myxococcaceae bacterium]|jgi:hypothetical protein|nr:hypothetical protein [Myxococcaceae bacterium]MCA3013559.1 hypothetical protein [Myxococcaceae bacterium]
MSLHAAVLLFAGDREAAAALSPPTALRVETWSLLPWARARPANDDVLLEASPEPLPTFHSTDSGLAWMPQGPR